MFVIKKEKAAKSIVNPSGERIYDLTGKAEELGTTVNQSSKYIEIPRGHSLREHYHEKSEETCIILKGSGKFIINNKEFIVQPGDVVSIKIYEVHEIFTEGREKLEFVTVSSPPLEVNDTKYTG